MIISRQRLSGGNESTHADRVVPGDNLPEVIDMARKQEREAEAAAERALAASKSFRRGVTATRAAVKFTSDHHQPPALQPLELPASPEKVGVWHGRVLHAEIGQTH